MAARKAAASAAAAAFAMAAGRVAETSRDAARDAATAKAAAPHMLSVPWVFAKWLDVASQKVGGSCCHLRPDPNDRPIGLESAWALADCIFIFLPSSEWHHHPLPQSSKEGGHGRCSPQVFDI